MACFRRDHRGGRISGIEAQTKSTFARRVRAARPRAKRYDIRDDMIPGLFLRVFPSGARSFALDRMALGRRRYATLGSADAMTVPEARAEARRLIAAFTETVRNDGGPRTPGHPMDAFAGEFLERYARHWKPSTLRNSAYIVRTRILPAFGHMIVDAIAVEHVRDWFASMADRPGSANRAMPVLSMMMRMAELWGYRAHNSNPFKNTRRHKMKPKERFLTAADEMARLNAVRTRNELWCPHIVAIVRLLMLTGCRFGEIAALEWDWVGDRRIFLQDVKTGPRAVPLGEAARALIEALPGARDPEDYLFPRHAEGRGTYSLTMCWRTVCADAKLGRLRLHDLRHTAASQAVMSGENLPLVGKLLGHQRHRTTAGYAHIDDAYLVEAAEKVGNLISEAMYR